MNYFEIKKIKCSYERKKANPKVVLEIDELNIPQGEVVFIVGQSGCGKSTILETLGLMNNTILTAETFDILPKDGEKIDGRIVWNESNKKLSEIRKKYFSFIFQDTNLMKNFTIEENAKIPQQIKGGQKKYNEILKEVYSKNDEWQEVRKKQNVGELSGGQRQRLAFVRAFLPNFQILFGDEPTGNLDPENADNLMKLVADEIHNDSGKSAIIVSHSPELSIKYADRIVKIHKKEIEKEGQKETYGKIDHDSIYETRNGQWVHGETEISNEELQILIKQ
jgi:ABC-type lipoprotein export system ATPase subunit